MKSRNGKATRRLSFVACFMIYLLCSVAATAWAQSATQLYQDGQAAFAKDNYLVAVKKLYAYQQISQAALQGNPAFSQKLQEAISYSEDQLRLAVETKRQLDTYGEVREIRFAASGRADDPNPKLETAKYRPPRPTIFRKPALPNASPGMQVLVANPNLIAISPDLFQQKVHVDPQQKTEIEKEQAAEFQQEFADLQEKYEKLMMANKRLSEENAMLQKKLELMAEENAVLKRKLENY